MIANFVRGESGTMDWCKSGKHPNAYVTREMPNCARIYFDTGVNGGRGMNVGNPPEKSNSVRFFHSRGQWLIRRHHARKTRVCTLTKNRTHVYDEIARKFRVWISLMSSKKRIPSERERGRCIIFPAIAIRGASFLCENWRNFSPRRFNQISRNIE